jgi:hypothetical protein
VTRWYKPVSGITPQAALTDLLSALQAQGYELSKDPLLPEEPSTAMTWSGDCKYNSEYCLMTIGLDKRAQRIEVYINPG